MSNILITGGTGLIGYSLSRLLISKGHTITILTRNRKKINSENLKFSYWDPGQEIIDAETISQADVIIHLAGENIGSGRWTSQKRDRIIKSRVNPLKLIERIIINSDNKTKLLISSSASGYYGAITSEKIFREEDAPGNDFLGCVCKKWEEAADSFEKSGIRVVKIRTGIVLSKTKGAFEKMSLSRKSGFLITPGDGRQFIPWIHIDDLCNIYLKAIEDESLNGAINAVAPDYTNYNNLNFAIRKTLKSKLPIIKVPAFIIRLILGEASDLILKGSRVSCKKLIDKNFCFEYPEISLVLKNLLF